MANLVLTSRTNTFTVTSNNYLNAIGTPVIILRKSDIKKVYINSTSEYIVIEVLWNKDFAVDLVGYLGGSTNKTVKIDTIDGVEPTSLSHLLELFETMLG